MKIAILISALVSVALAKVDYTGHQVYRAFPNKLQHEIIKGFGDSVNMDVWSDYRGEGDFIDFRVSPDWKPKIDVLLARNRISHEVFVEDLEVSFANRVDLNAPRLGPADPQFYEKYHTFSEISNWIDEFVSMNSALVGVTNIGKSYEGRDIRSVKVSTGADRPAFVINCGLHAREWVTPATCMYVANQLTSRYGIDDAVTNVMNQVDIYFIPVSNPDGYEYTWTTDRMWRKTRSAANSDCLTKCYGVDPNRNWDNHWNATEGSSDKCCSDTFRGPEAFSEVEVSSQRDFVLNIPKVKAYIDVHAYSQYWMYPYGWSETPAKDENTLAKVGKDSIDAIEAVHGKKYVTGSIANVIYVATGSSADYFYDEGITCSFAAELRDRGRYGFELPEAQILPTGEEAFAGLMVMARAVADGTC
uniref:carboxypeptidase B-like n=1 Tax=Styela clava TaxID=7725 RepID=UPI00193A5AD6|nr:carboxypeptidase B-like [Styela clava]